jgi:hypothetical protein
LAKKCPIGIEIAKPNKMEVVNMNTVLRNLVRVSSPQKGMLSLLKGLVYLVRRFMCLSKKNLIIPGDLV